MPALRRGPGVPRLPRRWPTNATVCGLPISRHDAGDGPAVFVILILGVLVVGLAILVEVTFSPPLWVHMVIWPPFILIVAIAMLRPLKATLLALQYRHRPETIDEPD